MATITEPKIRNFAELEHFIKENPQRAQILANKWRQLVKKHPELHRIKTSEQYHQFVNDNPNFGLDPGDWFGKEIWDTYTYLRPKPQPTNELKKPDLHAESNVAGALGILPAAVASLFVKPNSMEEDKKYQKIMGNLEKKWMQERGKDFFQTQEGMDYYFGALDDFDKRTIKDDAQEEFRKQHPKEAERYDKKRLKNEKKIAKKYGFFGKAEAENDEEYQKELARMEQHKASRFEELDKKIKNTRDPAEKERLAAERKELEKKIEEKHLNDFCKNNRYKAEAYAATNPKIKAALDTLKAKEALRAPKISLERPPRPPRPPTPPTPPQPTISLVRPPRAPIPATTPAHTPQPPTPQRSQQRDERQRSGNFIDRINNARDFARRVSNWGKTTTTGEATGVAGTGGASAAAGGTGAATAGSGAAIGGTAGGVVVAGTTGTAAGFSGGTILAIAGPIIVGVLLLLSPIIIIILVILLFGSNNPLPGSEPERGGDIYSCTFYRKANTPSEIQLTFGTKEMASLISDVSAKVGVPAAVIGGIMAVESSQGITQTNVEFVTNDYAATTSKDENGNPVAIGIMQFTPRTFRGVHMANINQLQTLFGKGNEMRDSVDPQDSAIAKDTSLFRIYSIKDSITAAAFKAKADKGAGPWNKEAIMRVAEAYYGCLRYKDGGADCNNGPYNYGEDLWKSFENCRPTVPGGGFMAGWPTSGKITQGILGKTSHGRLFRDFLEQAIDIGNNTGTPVYSTLNGVVKTVDDSCITDFSCRTAYGNYVELSDSAFTATIRYAHLSLISVRQGQNVNLGTKVGEIGATGGDYGPHLHYAIMDGLASRPNDPIKMEPPNIPEKITPDNCDVPSLACQPAQVFYAPPSQETTTPSTDSYWFLLERKSKRETLYQGTPADTAKSKVIRSFQVNPGWPGQTPTPLSTKLGNPYWIITQYKINTTDEKKATLGPYFFSLNIPINNPGRNCLVNGVATDCQGPVPYLECPDMPGSQCYWPVPGDFGLHGIGNDASRLTNEGSNGCIRHSNEDITYLYNLLSSYNPEVRYYIVDQ